MISLILTGGLGNQMFQYAAAKSLALRLGDELTVDLYALNKPTQATKRQLALNIFDIKLNISSNWKTEFLIKAFPLVNNSRYLFSQLMGYFRDKSAIVYASDFDELSGNIILHGHFQNEKYFEKYEDIIRKDFSFKRMLQGRNAALGREIRDTQSVSIHVRRGDYLTNAQASKNFAICDKGYYQHAISKIKEEVDTPHFYVFSEDFEWVQENISFDDAPVQYIDWNKGSDSYVDMQLMSMCKHNIIANSSFSWWAAWLNSYEWKIVYAPAEWFQSEERNKDLKDFYPQGWKMI